MKLMKLLMRISEPAEIFEWRKKMCKQITFYTFDKLGKRAALSRHEKARIFNYKKTKWNGRKIMNFYVMGKPRF